MGPISAVGLGSSLPITDRQTDHSVLQTTHTHRQEAGTPFYSQGGQGSTLSSLPGGQGHRLSLRPRVTVSHSQESALLLIVGPRPETWGVKMKNNIMDRSGLTLRLVVSFLLARFKVNLSGQSGKTKYGCIKAKMWFRHKKNNSDITVHTHLQY